MGSTIHIAAKDYGTAEIVLDGVKLKSVRSYSIVHRAGYLPVVTLDIFADNLTVDFPELIPQLPTPFDRIFKLNESSAQSDDEIISSKTLIDRLPP